MKNNSSSNSLSSLAPKTLRLARWFEDLEQFSQTASPERIAHILTVARRVPTITLASAERLADSLTAILESEDLVHQLYGRLVDVPEIALAEPLATLVQAYDLDIRTTLCEGSKHPADARLALLLALMHPHSTDWNYYASLSARERRLTWLWDVFSDPAAYPSLTAQLVEAREKLTRLEVFVPTTNPWGGMSQAEFDTFRNRLREVYNVHGVEAAMAVTQMARQAV